MLNHEETMQLIAMAQQGDESATSTLIQENTPLIKSIVKRYMGKHVEYDDLFQISSIGLLKAIKNFKCEYNVRFSTYAVPMILGEIKRYMRDDGYVKVSRSTKSLAGRIIKYVETQQSLGAEPTVDEIARQFRVDATEVVFALDSMKMPVSLYESATDNDGKQSELIDRIPNDDDKGIIDKVILNDMLNSLTPRERKIVILRYFRDMTQSEIAHHLGVSQVQVSRLENKIIEKLKNSYNQN